MAADRASFEQFWVNFGPVIKEGIYEDFEKKDNLLEIALFKNSNSTKLITLDEYIETMDKKQMDIYFITGDSYDNIINKLTSISVLPNFLYSIIFSFFFSQS